MTRSSSRLAARHFRLTSLLCVFASVVSFFIHRNMLMDHLRYLEVSATIEQVDIKSIHLSTNPQMIFLESSWTLQPLSNSSVHSEHRYEVEHQQAAKHDRTRSYGNTNSNDLPFMERRRWPQHEFLENCEPIDDWQSFYPINCNSIHETSLEEGTINQNLHFLGGDGFWRTPWELVDPILHESLVLKTFRLEHDIEEAYIENNRVDALAMERLTSSPHVINAYAYCGLSVVTDFAGLQIANIVGKYNSSQKLALAVNITQGLADIHSIGGKHSLVHNDINLANLVITKDKRPVWNDFNIAVLQMKDRDTGSLCPFKSHFENPAWRAPEEIRSADYPKPPIVDDKIEIYSLGNVYYRLIVGRSPWKRIGMNRLTEADKRRVAKVKRDGGIPPVPDEVKRSDDPATRVLLEAMYDCFRLKPAERPDAVTLAVKLRDVYDRIVANTTHVISRSSSSRS